MLILCDVDGVFADFLKHTLDTLGPLAPPGGREVFTSWDLRENMSPEAQMVVDRKWREKGWCLGIPAYPEAKEGLAALNSIGDVVWVTSPMPGSPHWILERTQWLRHLTGKDNPPIIFAKDKSSYPGDVFIDDRIDNVEDWAYAHQGGLPIVWDHPYNRSKIHPRIQRADSWGRVLQLIQERKP